MPIITFSNQPNQGTILTAFNLEVDDYLSKPVDITDLANMILKWSVPVDQTPEVGLARTA